MFDRIAHQLDRDLPIATLFEAPTIRDIADRMLRDGWEPAWTPVVTIQPHGTRPPLFCVHSGGGNILTYHRVSHYLGSEQPLYGVQSKGLMSGEETAGSVEEMAATYVEEIRRIQPHGPYHLTGHSLGALISYEMARQLRAAGEAVAMVAIIDFPGPDARLSSLDRLLRHLRTVRGIKPGKRLSYITEGMRWRLINTRWLPDRIRARVVDGFSGGTRSRTEQRKRRLASSLEALDNYYIRPYAGRVCVLRAMHGPAGVREDPQGGWGKVAGGGVDVVDLSGGHMELFDEPYVRDLARGLDACLAQARTRSAVGS
jgi:aspartate racemase